MKKGVLNIITDFFSQILLVGLGIIIPRLILINLGSEANGLMTSIGSALSYLSLLEAGIGGVALVALYKPSSENDHKSVNAIISAANKFYQKIGKIYIICVLFIAISYSHTVITTISQSIVFFTVLISGITGSLGYFFTNKLILVLQGEGKSYVVTSISTLFSTLTSIFKICLLISGGGILELQVLFFLIAVLKAVSITIYIKKKYPWLDYSVTPDENAIRQKGAVLLHKLSGLVFSGTDVVLLTYVTNLSLVSVYNMYAMVFGMMKSVTVALTDGFVFLLGHNYHNKEKFTQLFDAYEVYNMSITFAVFCTGYLLVIPFLQLYTLGVSDINYIDRRVAFLFVVYYLIENGRKPSLTVATVAGKFEETKWRAVTEAGINLTVSVFMTFRFGIYGVLIGTIAGLSYRLIDAILFAAKLMERSAWITTFRWIRNVCIFIIITYWGSCISVDLSTYKNIIGFGFILSSFTLCLFFGVNALFEPKVARMIYGYFSEKITQNLTRNHR